MKIKTKIILSIIAFFILLNLVSAKNLEERVRQVLNVLKDKVNEILGLFFCLIWWIIAAIAALLIAWNSVKYISSENFEERIIARKRIVQTIFGLIIVLIACPLVNFLIKGTQISEFKCECIKINETETTRPTTTTIATTQAITTMTTTKTITTLTTSTTTAISTTTTIQSKSILIYDFGSYGSLFYHDNLRSLLESKGYSVDHIIRSGPSDPSATLTISILEKYNQIWFFDTSLNRVISETEVNNVFAYYNNGGNILLSGEAPENCWENINLIAQKLGVSMSGTVGSLEAFGGCVTPTFSIHPITKNLNSLASSYSDVGLSTSNPNAKKVCMYTAASVDSSAPSYPCIIVLEPVGGKGKAIFDSSSFRFMDPLGGNTDITTCDDTQYVLNILSWFESNNSESSSAKIRAKEEADWIVSKCKRSSGALSIAPGGGINPYFANLAAQALLEVDGSYKTDVKDYILWYLAHINKPDNLGVYGTIYDYSVVDGSEKSLENYDSSDSYAATFLSLVRRYYDKSGDLDFIKNNLNDLKIIAGAIDATLQEDGLTWAKKNYQIKFLMDNIEVWQGYRDFAYLLDVAGDMDAEKYREREKKVREGIENYLWDNKNQEYRPYVGGKTNWNNFYPDASANLWPIIFGLPEANTRKSILWHKFISNNPKWKTNQADAFPWTVNNIAALDVGDRETAKEFDANTRKKFLPERKWPWNINEAGWYIRYTLRLED